MNNFPIYHMCRNSVRITFHENFQTVYIYTELSFKFLSWHQRWECDSSWLLFAGWGCFRRTLGRQWWAYPFVTIAGQWKENKSEKRIDWELLLDWCCNCLAKTLAVYATLHSIISYNKRPKQWTDLRWNKKNRVDKLLTDLQREQGFGLKAFFFSFSLVLLSHLSLLSSDISTLLDSSHQHLNLARNVGIK